MKLRIVHQRADMDSLDYVAEVLHEEENMSFTEIQILSSSLKKNGITLYNTDLEQGEFSLGNLMYVCEGLTMQEDELFYEIVVSGGKNDLV